LYQVKENQGKTTPKPTHQTPKTQGQGQGRSWTSFLLVRKLTSRRLTVYEPSQRLSGSL